MGKIVKGKKSNFENIYKVVASCQYTKGEANTTNKTGPIRVRKKKHQTEINLARNEKIQRKGKDRNLSSLSIREDEAFVL